MLIEAVFLMLTGMGVVFAFLLVLTGLTYLLTWSCPPSTAPDSEPDTAASETRAAAELAEVPPEHLAAISAALAAYRARE